MTEPAANPAYSHPLRVADLPLGRDHTFELGPDAAARGRIADLLGLPRIRKLRFAGRLSPLGRTDWQLDADLGATVVQECVITLEPVTTRIDEPVRRTFLSAGLEMPEAEEMEMPDDDTVEALPDTLDLGAVMIEALALALPPYPQIEGARAMLTDYTEPGQSALDDDAVKPFAGLAALRDKLGKPDD